MPLISLIDFRRSEQLGTDGGTIGRRCTTLVLESNQLLPKIAALREARQGETRPRHPAFGSQFEVWQRRAGSVATESGDGVGQAQTTPDSAAIRSTVYRSD